MIAIEQLTKRYPDGTVAVDGVSFDVPRGQFCVLLGSSGAGKSTLLKMLNGLIPPSGGTVKIADEVFSTKTAARLQREVAMIHQHFNLVGRSTVERNVLAGAVAALPGWRIALGVYPPSLRRRAAVLLDELGLSEKQFQRRAAALSGGQQQRVGIARAFLLHPAVVLADEPVASLDPAVSVEILAALQRKAREEGATVVCSLHQVELARAFADRVIGMQGGRIVFDGPPIDLTDEQLEELYRKPAA